MDFEIGTSVKIISVPDKYKKYLAELMNASGTIEDIYFNPDRSYPYAIMIEGLINPASSTGCFWMNETNFKELKNEEENDNMNKYNNGDYKFCTVVSFDDNERVSVCAYLGEVKEGDMVICDFGYSNGALSARKVAELFDCGVTTVHGEILGVADCTKYFEYKAREKARAELKKKMAEQAKRYQEESFWRMIAETDPEMKKLYDAFMELSK